MWLDQLFKSLAASPCTAPSLSTQTPWTARTRSLDRSPFCLIPAEPRTQYRSRSLNLRQSFILTRMTRRKVVASFHSRVSNSRTESKSRPKPNPPLDSRRHPKTAIARRDDKPGGRISGEDSIICCSPVVGAIGHEVWGTATSFQFFLPLKPFLWHR